MKSEYLNEVQLEQIQTMLKKYGIESTDLLEELTDHYAGEMEERIKEGSSFDKVFQDFVSQNSWLKLRRLQHAHWKYSEKSLFKFVRGSLAELYSSFRLVFVILAIALLYFLLTSQSDTARIGIITLHFALIFQTLFIAVASFRVFKKYKMVDVSYTFQVSAMIFYTMVMPSWSGTLDIFEPMVSAEAGIFAQMFYYLVIMHLTYVHHCLYQRAMVYKKKHEGEAAS